MKKKSFKEITLSALKCYSFVLFPFLICMVVILLNISFYKLQYLSILSPYFFYIMIYYFAIKAAEFFHCYHVLVLGLVKDIIDSEILGTNALMFVMLWGITRYQDKYINKSKPFIVIWLGFVCSLFLISFLPLVLQFCGFSLASYPINIVSWRVFITIFAYVPIHWLLDKIYE